MAGPSVAVLTSTGRPPAGTGFAHAAGSVVGWVCVLVVVVLVVRKWRRQYKDAVALRQHLETTVSQLQDAQAEARAAATATGGSVVVNAPGVQAVHDDAFGGALGDHAPGLRRAVPAGLDRGVAALPVMVDRESGFESFRPERSPVSVPAPPPPPPPPPPGRHGAGPSMDAA